MRNILLTDGTVYPIDRCGATVNELTVNIISDDTMLDLVSKFGVPENVSRIEHYFDGTETDHRVFEGYTKLSAMYLTGTGTTITLQKG